jgi:hypothetical protein
MPTVPHHPLLTLSKSDCSLSINYSNIHNGDLPILSYQVEIAQ